MNAKPCLPTTKVHTMEGPDDMPGHVKSSLFGVSLNVPISNGSLALVGLVTFNGAFQRLRAF